MKQRIISLFLIIIVALVAGCGGQPAAAPPNAELDLTTLSENVDAQTVNQLRERADVLLIDVREPWEYNEAHIPGVTLIPMGEIPNRLSEIPQDKTVIVSCRSGNRSSQVVEFLQGQGFTNVHNLSGGILAWQGAGLPVE
ncbi:MAG: rhodanese-like domain-containing protein [Caldilineaceae bacterium]